VETGYDTTTVLITETQYAPCACSPLGKVSAVSLPHAPGATVYWTTYTYDARGRTLTETKPDGSVTAYQYTANTTKAIDPTGKWKQFTYDAQGNLVPDRQLCLQS
jgi:RHS Repeat